MRNIATIASDQLGSRIESFLSKAPKTNEPSESLGADFRIGPVRSSWDRLLAEAGDRSFTILSIRVSCGSGTYMRSLAGRLGASLETNALALSIHRTRIGRHWKGWWFNYE